VKKTILVFVLAVSLAGCMNIVIKDIGTEALKKCGALSRFRTDGGGISSSSSFEFNCTRHADR
jgi:hypothetical protein